MMQSRGFGGKFAFFILVEKKLVGRFGVGMAAGFLSHKTRLEFLFIGLSPYLELVG